MKFVFCLHFHQPPGNLAEVNESAYQRAYWPTLQTIAGHPSIKVVLHHSGCLMEDMLLDKPEYLDLVRQLIERGQVEILSSPIYDPILPVIPERDRLGQIRAHQELIERTFGVVPRGMWLPERVWEPSLPKVIGQSGLDYAPIDDTPFLQVGVPEKRLYDSYLTEEEGLPLRVFPIPRAIRHLIPSARPEEVMAQLLRRQSGGAKVAVFADAAEKFGEWPGSYEGVQERNWLGRFFSLMTSEQNRIQTSTFEEYVDSFEPGAQIYLPSSTYSEMLEWSIPTGAQQVHHDLRARLEQEGEGLDRLLGMGHWRSFLCRYPESNWMHKRGLDLGRRLRLIEDRGADPDQVDQARRHLWRSQSNAAYWHGVSGGLYLPHLRGAVHASQNAAWRILDDLEHGNEPFRQVSHRDIDLDGEDEVVLENRSLALTFAPSDGGTMVAADVKAKGVNLFDVVARREEPYHRAIRDRKDEIRGARKTRGRSRVGDYLNYDPFPLYSARDHILPAGISLADLKELRTLGSPPSRARFTWEPDDGDRLRLRTEVRVDASRLEVERVVSLDEDAARFEIRWILRWPESRPESPCGYATEWTFGLEAPSKPIRQVVINDGDPRSAGSEEAVEDVRTFQVVDHAREFAVSLELSNPVTLLRYPVNTVVLSSSGPERVFQGTRMFLCWPLLEAQTELVVRVSIDTPVPLTPAEVAAGTEEA